MAKVHYLGKQSATSRKAVGLAFDSRNLPTFIGSNPLVYLGDDHALAGSFAEQAVRSTCNRLMLELTDHEALSVGMRAPGFYAVDFKAMCSDGHKGEATSDAPRSVLAVWGYLERPIEGIAVFRNRPTYFVAEGGASEHGWRRYRTASVDAETISLALEHERIWAKWYDGIRLGEVEPRDHPESNPWFADLRTELNKHRRALASVAVRGVRGRFERVGDDRLQSLRVDWRED